DGRDALKAMMLTSNDNNIRDEAALVLAENGNLLMPEVRARIFSLFTEPTERGERALNLLKRADIVTKTPNTESGYTKGMELIQELVSNIRSAYPDETKVDYEKLFQN